MSPTFYDINLCQYFIDSFLIHFENFFTGCDWNRQKCDWNAIIYQITGIFFKIDLMIIDCISDLHGYHPELEGGDLLIIAGDLTSTHSEVEHFAIWRYLSNLNYHKVIIIAGNHDSYLKTAEGEVLIRNFSPHLQYLCDEGIIYDGYKIWGSPWTLKFKGINPNCTAFTGSEEELKEKWDLIPDDVDILVTHSPPYGIMDEVKDYKTGNIRRCGSKTLYEKVYSMKNYPKLWIWGHIHEGYGSYSMTGISNNKLIMVNASHVDECYDPINKPIRVEL